MTSRAANAAIKGYFYQFDHSILQILKLSAADLAVTVEGIEDIDLNSEDESHLIQCKYYEKTEYNHSEIKYAIIGMLRNFKAAISTPTKKVTYYRLYGHYKCGTDKLPTPLDVVFLKKHLLSYRRKGVFRETHTELGLSDQQLEAFLKVLSIDLRANSYDEQHADIVKQLMRNIPGSSKDDVISLYYPAAMNVIQSLAIKSKIAERKITKANFIQAINRKEPIFATWLQQKFGNDYYAKMLRRKYFRFPQKVPKKTRIFSIEFGEGDDQQSISTLLERIGQKFSHIEHTRTPTLDRFCPYIILRGVSDANIAVAKQQLLDQGLRIEDGHAFFGSTFSPTYLVDASPTKERLIKIKFIPSPDQVPAIAPLLKDVTDVFDFYTTSPIQRSLIQPPLNHYEIKIQNPYFINEIISR